MRLYVFDDAIADGWAPFALTRPCSELLFGSFLLRERAERAVGARADGILTRAWLADFGEASTPPVVRLATIAPAEDRLFLSSRLVPGGPIRAGFGAATTLHVDGETVGCYLPSRSPTPPAAWFGHPGPLPDADETELPGTALRRVWDLVDRNPDRLLADLRAAAEGGGRRAAGLGGPPAAASLPDGVERIGDDPVLLGEGVRIEPGVLLDTRGGPIRLDDEVEVRFGARLAGPLHAGFRCRLLGGPLELLSAGPLSHLRGEIEASVVLGYANKAHDGFLGHAYLGRWVNLGAMTTNSDLKNNYSTVRVGPPGERVDTGLLKLGCLLGDHVKTGIGLMLGTGTIVGAGSNLVGDGSPAAWVPPFSWGIGPGSETYRRDAFLRTSERVMARRGVELDAGARRWLAAAWEAGTGGGA